MNLDNRFSEQSSLKLIQQSVERSVPQKPFSSSGSWGALANPIYSEFRNRSRRSSGLKRPLTTSSSRADRIKKLPYKPANVKLAEVKRAINAVIREQSVRKDRK
jgi:hypothetical protein